MINLKFFDATFISPSLSNYTFILFIWITIFLSVPHFFTNRKTKFDYPIAIVFSSIFFSMVMAFLSWNQSLFHSIIETSQYLSWPFYFYLVGHNFKVNTIEKIVVAFGLLYVMLYFYQYLNQGAVLFGKPLYGDEWTEDRGVIRIIFPGAGIFILTVFIALTKLTSKAPLKWLWVCILILGLVIPVMQVTRQFIAGVTLVYLYHLIVNVKAIYRVFIISFFLIGISVVVKMEIDSVKGVIEAGERDADLGKDYVRVLAAEYFLFDYAPNDWSRIFGSGAPYWGISSVGKFNERLGDEKGYYLSDVGIIAVYAMFGIAAVIGFILIWYKSFVLPLPKEFQYARYYLWYILFTSVTWFSVYHYHYIISTILAMYLFQKGYDLHVRKELLKKVFYKLKNKQAAELDEVG
ncbi:hypothetical protein [Indibacter alkaliphilus]|uniref:hypothetical protein n=1 Tax=Indibacter alkaliphilus TaxID=579922 RepID=UPI001F34BA22|nr:hypothetical protein [Indibacter alkaliphilus]